MTIKKAKRTKIGIIVELLIGFSAFEVYLLSLFKIISMREFYDVPSGIGVASNVISVGALMVFALVRQQRSECLAVLSQFFIATVLAISFMWGSIALALICLIILFVVGTVSENKWEQLGRNVIFVLFGMFLLMEVVGIVYRYKDFQAVRLAERFAMSPKLDICLGITFIALIIFIPEQKNEVVRGEEEIYATENWTDTTTKAIAYFFLVILFYAALVVFWERFVYGQYISEYLVNMCRMCGEKNVLRGAKLLLTLDGFLGIIIYVGMLYLEKKKHFHDSYSDAIGPAFIIAVLPSAFVGVVWGNGNLILVIVDIVCVVSYVICGRRGLFKNKKDCRCYILIILLFLTAYLSVTLFYKLNSYNDNLELSQKIDNVLSEFEVSEIYAPQLSDETYTDLIYNADFDYERRISLSSLDGCNIILTSSNFEQFDGVEFIERYYGNVFFITGDSLGEFESSEKYDLVPLKIVRASELKIDWEMSDSMECVILFIGDDNDTILYNYYQKLSYKVTDANGNVVVRSNNQSIEMWTEYPYIFLNCYYSSLEEGEEYTVEVNYSEPRNGTDELNDCSTQLIFAR